MFTCAERRQMEDRFAMILEERRRYLEYLAAQKEEALRNVPEGSLRCSKSGKTREFYRITEPGERTGHYIPVSQRELARALAQKGYDQTILRHAQEELKRIQKLENARLRTVEEVYDHYSPPRKALVNPIRLPDDEYVQKWLSVKYKQPGFDEKAPKFFSRKGLRVRSKSESDIADILDDFGIPYFYERPAFLSRRGWVNPDFTTLNVRLRKTILWEHLGKMDDEEYIADNLDKLEAYEEDGYFQGENFIVTMETKRCPLTPVHVERIVRHYLL